MGRKPRTRTYPIEREIERAFNPGAFIPDRECYSFVSDLDEVAAKIAKLTSSDPARAVTLYETFLAGCYEKIEELDDSSGSFGQLVEDLYCGWVKARQANHADPDKTASRLLCWMDDDDYGFCYGLEKGVAKVFDKAGLDLARLKRELLTKLGRGNEALDAAWTDYREHPSTYTYDELMKFVPKTERPQWHKKAIDAAGGADLRSIMELLLATKEMVRLCELVRQAEDRVLESLSHFIAEPAARKLEKSTPDLAARLWRAQGMRIVNAKKSKYYDAALSNFESAKRCFERAGLATEWEKTVDQVRADHQRKTGFMPGFESLAAGSGPSDEPSFLERAKARWHGRERKS